MRTIKISHVVSASDTDKGCAADNLVKDEGKKFRGAQAGVKTVEVVLQLEKPEAICELHVGNEASAFVEILVAKSSANDYQVLLPTSKLMDPNDARSGSNLQQVKMFDKERLKTEVAQEKWDRVKIVCMQTYTKALKYGLSFVRFFTPGEEKKTSPQKQLTLGGWALKDADDKIVPGKLFANRKTETTSPSHEIRRGREITPLKRKASVDGDDVIAEKRFTSPTGKSPLSRQNTSISSTASTSSAPPLKRVKSEPRKSSPDKQFRKLMEKVTFVISGFKNPTRSDIRDRALEMGATYRPDWDRRCTHLICAFSNTPKFLEVNGKGRIVSNRWIDACYKAKKLLPWRRFRLDDADSPEGSSSGEETAATSKQERSKESKVLNFNDSTEEDTDEEIKRVKDGQNKGKSPARKTNNNAKRPRNSTNDPFNDSTDDESPEIARLIDDFELPELLDLFTGKQFYLYGDFKAEERQRLVKLIYTYDGEEAKYMSSDVNYVLTHSEWDDNFDDALEASPNINFLRPAWLIACDEKQRLLPHQKFVIVPS